MVEIGKKYRLKNSKIGSKKIAKNLWLFALANTILLAASHQMVKNMCLIKIF